MSLYDICIVLVSHEYQEQKNKSEQITVEMHGIGLLCGNLECPEWGA